MSYAEKAIERAQRDCEELAKEYDVPSSAVVWTGGNRYIVIKDGKQIRV